MFKTLPHSKKDIVFLGNSITFWGGWSELLGSLYVKDRGIPGDNTYGVLERLGEIIKGQPAKVFILIGINDLAAHIPDSIIIKNTYRIADKIRSGSPRTKIYLQTILPTNNTFNKLTSHYNKGEDIKKINAALKEFAAEKRIGWIDLYSHFTDASGKLKKEYTWDGVHLTRKGYNVWIDVLRQDGYLKRILK